MLHINPEQLICQNSNPQYINPLTKRPPLNSVHKRTPYVCLQTKIGTAWAFTPFLIYLQPTNKSNYELTPGKYTDC